MSVYAVTASQKCKVNTWLNFSQYICELDEYPGSRKFGMRAFCWHCSSADSCQSKNPAYKYSLIITFSIRLSQHIKNENGKTSVAPQLLTLLLPLTFTGSVVLERKIVF